MRKLSMLLFRIDCELPLTHSPPLYTDCYHTNYRQNASSPSIDPQKYTQVCACAHTHTRVTIYILPFQIMLRLFLNVIKLTFTIFCFHYQALFLVLKNTQAFKTYLKPFSVAFCLMEKRETNKNQNVNQLIQCIVKVCYVQILHRMLQQCQTHN